MKAMWAGFAAIVIIAAVAGIVLDSAQMSAGEQFSTESTRLR